MSLLSVRSLAGAPRAPAPLPRRPGPRRGQGAARDLHQPQRSGGLWRSRAALGRGGGLADLKPLERVPAAAHGPRGARSRGGRRIGHGSRSRRRRARARARTGGARGGRGRLPAARRLSTLSTGGGALVRPGACGKGRKAPGARRGFPRFPRAEGPLCAPEPVGRVGNPPRPVPEGIISALALLLLPGPVSRRQLLLYASPVNMEAVERAAA